MDSINLDIPRLTSFYLDYLQHHDVAKMIRQAAEYYNQSTLIRLAQARQVDTRRAATLILGFLGDFCANEILGHLLHDDDRSVRLLAENSLKNIWPRDGSEDQRHALTEIMRHIGQQEYDEAIRIANILLEEAPLYAEARNQRAIALFALGEFQDSAEDSSIVLDLNPFHFGAAIGMAHAYLQMNDRDMAVVCFEHALQINPNLESVRRHLDRIQQR